MEPEKTLLQQIREKEQEYKKKTERIREETNAAVAAARIEAENLLCTADSTGKTDAEQLYWLEKAKIEAVIEQLNNSAAAGREAAMARAEKNLPRAIERITDIVTME
jgi:hypothetical protein